MQGLGKTCMYCQDGTDVLVLWSGIESMACRGWARLACTVEMASMTS